MSGEDQGQPLPRRWSLPDRLDWRHWAGFVASGLMAFTVDAVMLEVGVRLFALDPLVARLGAISLAMIVGWLAHRRLTFAVTTPPTLAELARYVAAAWSGAAVNYATFATLLLSWPSLPRLAALLASSTVTMIFSYFSMKYAVFTSTRS